MKRIIAIVMGLLLIMCLAGCTSDDLNERKIQKINDLDTYVVKQKNNIVKLALII